MLTTRDNSALLTTETDNALRQFLNQKFESKILMKVMHSERQLKDNPNLTASWTVFKGSKSNRTCM